MRNMPILAGTSHGIGIAHLTSADNIFKYSSKPNANSILQNTIACNVKCSAELSQLSTRGSDY